MAVKERLTKFIFYKNISKSEFCRTIGVSSAFISSMRVSIQPDKIESIALNYPELNTGWLLTGDGEMLKSDGSNTQTKHEMDYKEKYYDYLKLVGAGAGINKNLTTHVARHTYATYLLNRNIPIETVSRCMGHANIRMTQNYARMLGKKVVDDMQVLLK